MTKLQNKQNEIIEFFPCNSINNNVKNRRHNKNFNLIIKQNPATRYYSTSHTGNKNATHSPQLDSKASKT